MPAFDAIGYSAEGTRRLYYIAMPANAVAYTGTVTGYSGSHSVAAITTANANIPWAWNPAPSTPNCGWTIDTGYPAQDPQFFDVLASAILCPGCYNDIWTINHLKVLSNCYQSI